MTLMAWIRVRVLGAADPALNAAVVEKIEREKLKLKNAQATLSHEVEAIKTHRKNGVVIFEILDDALRTLDKRR